MPSDLHFKHKYNDNVLSVQSAVLSGLKMCNLHYYTDIVIIRDAPIAIFLAHSNFTFLFDLPKLILTDSN